MDLWEFWFMKSECEFMIPWRASCIHSLKYYVYSWSSIPCSSFDHDTEMYRYFIYHCGKKVVPPITTNQPLTFPSVFINIFLYTDSSKILYVLVCWYKKKKKENKLKNLLLALILSLTHLPKSDTSVDEREFTLLDKFVNLRLSSAVV